MSHNSQEQNSNNNAWSIERAREFYSISVWSEGYFDLNVLGHIVAKPDKNVAIDLIEVSQQIKSRGLSLPVLVRFPQILQARVIEIDGAFKQAAMKFDCSLSHIPCYPIKVNQQKTVVEQILKSNCEQIGLEVGSKTELLAALGLLDESQPCLICNGYKDRTYVRLALYAQSMGIDVYIVIENPSELNLIKNESKRLGLTPKVGLRIKLNSIAEGKWQNSGGKDAKFGLDAKDILYCINKLKQWGDVHWLQLIHFHMGSQISKLNEFANGLNEAMNIYSEISSQGFRLSYLDVGGGLAIDYASQHDASYFSRSYSIQEYADIIVSTVTNYCQENSLEIPIVLTENGRAITAHHAMLMTNIVKVKEHEDHKPLLDHASVGCEELYVLGESLLEMYRKNSKHLKQKIQEFESRLQQNILHGEISLRQRAWAESILQKTQSNEECLNENMQHLSCRNTEKYYCNLSIFQSMPDVWGLKQIFPILPLARLSEKPLKCARLHDLTCDSDGQIDQYAFDNLIHDYLTLHEISEDEEYLLGFFLLGAYQEVLGDMHNLFGDTHALNVEQDSQGQLQFTDIEIGDCVNELLTSIHLDGEQILQRCKSRLSELESTNVTADEILEDINNALYGYTYLDSIDRPAHRIKR